tara:strand:- start:724 stop:900 length:177 start_codon:yes stop_codon:yes gene_type:complete
MHIIGRVAPLLATGKHSLHGSLVSLTRTSFPRQTYTPQRFPVRGFTPSTWTEDPIPIY